MIQPNELPAAVRYEKQAGGVVLITINNASRENCIDEEVHEGLCEAWVKFRKDPELNVAVLTGAGEKSFCSGWDIKGYAKRTSTLSLNDLRERAAYEPGLGGLTRGVEVYKPIIAAINGYCLAGGMELAMACDIRFSVPEAQFGVLNRRWDIGCESGLTQRLPHIVGLGNALDLNQVVPREALLDKALEYARQIAALPQASLRTDKESVLRGLGRPLQDGLWMENTLWNSTVHSEELENGISRFGARQ
jgi:enoyl-CoA hydratase